MYGDAEDVDGTASEAAKTPAASAPIRSAFDIRSTPSSFDDTEFDGDRSHESAARSRFPGTLTNF
jgi:hypothetical protein